MPTDPNGKGLVVSDGTESTLKLDTSFWIDPSEHLVGVFMSQVRPVDSDVADKFRTLIYQALK